MNHNAFIFFLVFSLLLTIVPGCSSIRYVQVPSISRDTLYVSNVQYDSIYVWKDKLIDRGKDTIYIKETEYKYKYKMLRDTVYKHSIDTVTVVKEVEIEKPVKYIPWYSKILNVIGLCALAILIFILIKKYWKLILPFT